MNFIDLHAHWLPAVDDGVKTPEDALLVIEGLVKLGFTRLHATPHLRSAMFPGTPEDRRDAYEKFEALLPKLPNVSFGLGAEHFVDDVFWQRFLACDYVAFPGGHSLLIEFPDDAFPLRAADLCHEIKVRGVVPVLAHPERYRQLFDKTDALDELIDAGVAPQLDLMALVGRYGDRPRRAAERMVDEGVYAIAASDVHRPQDIGLVEAALKRLAELAGGDEVSVLLADNPQRLLDGRPLVL